MGVSSAVDRVSCEDGQANISVKLCRAVYRAEVETCCKEEKTVWILRSYLLLEPEGLL